MHVTKVSLLIILVKSNKFFVAASNVLVSILIRLCAVFLFQETFEGHSVFVLA